RKGNRVVRRQFRPAGNLDQRSLRALPSCVQANKLSWKCTTRRLATPTRPWLCPGRARVCCLTATLTTDIYQQLAARRASIANGLSRALGINFGEVVVRSRKRLARRASIIAARCALAELLLASHPSSQAVLRNLSCADTTLDGEFVHKRGVCR